VVAYGSPSPRPERCIVLEKYHVIYKRIGGPEKQCLVGGLAFVIIYFIWLIITCSIFLLGLAKVFVTFVKKIALPFDNLPKSQFLTLLQVLFSSSQ
jgi:hypothetical protein